MASRGPHLSAGRSPLRSQLSRRHKPSISSAASAHLRHLHQVAAWASLLVPTLGAFLGSRLASTSEVLGCPPPSSPHFTCQRCESILQVGINCSVRVRSRKLKKRVTETKGVSVPINSFIYFCQHCAFESVISGTSKAYVKSKLSEVAAHHRLSEPYQSLDVCMSEKVAQPIKLSSSESQFSPTCLTESQGNTIKKTKRRGWLSLKQLAASSADLSRGGSRPVDSPKSDKTPLLAKLRRLDSARVMPTVSQVDLKCLPTSGIEGECPSRTVSIKNLLELEPSDGDIEKTASLSKLEQCIATTARMVHPSEDIASLCAPQSEESDSLGVVATSLRSNSEVITPIFSNVGELICPEKLPANRADSYLELQQSDGPEITTMNVEDKGLQQNLSVHHSDADAATQFTILASILKCSVQGTASTFEAQCNLSGAVSQANLAIVAPTSSIQDSVKPIVGASVPLMDRIGIDYFDDKVLDFPVGAKEAQTNKIVRVNAITVNAVTSKKRRHDEDNNWWKVPRKQENCKTEADRLRLGTVDRKETSGIYMSSCTMPVGLKGSTCENIDTKTFTHERKAKSRTKKKPLFRRVGHRWFTICKSGGTLKWRII